MLGEAISTGAVQLAFQRVSTNRNAPVWVTILAVVAGIALVGVGVVYFADSAANLPGFFPGHEAGVTTHHIKHGIAAVAVGIAAFVGAWISPGSKRDRTTV